MRISYFHYLYGAGTPLHHVNQFTAAARALGHEVAVHAMNLAPGAHSADGNGNSDGAARAWLKQKFSRYLHEPKELLWNARYIRRELEIARSERPDVLLVRNNQLTAAEVAVSRLTGIPLVLEINAPATEAESFYDEYAHIPWLSTAAERIGVRGADRIVVVSGPLRDYLVKTHGVSPDKITVNHNGGDCERFHPGIDSAPLRTRLGLGRDPVVGFVGSFHPWHGLDLLKTMIEALAPKGARFLLVGQGPEWNDFGRWLDASGYRERTALVGRIDHAEVPAHLAAMDVAVVPNLAFYMSPLKLLEYMAAGKAVVAPRQAAITELLYDGEQALLFTPDDTDAAVCAIASLLDDEELRRRMGASARSKVEAELTWGHNAERVLAACAVAAAPRLVGARVAASLRP